MDRVLLSKLTFMVTPDSCRTVRRMVMVPRSRLEVYKQDGGPMEFFKEQWNTAGVLVALYDFVSS